jgi:hypothetical protein
MLVFKFIEIKVYSLPNPKGVENRECDGTEFHSVEMINGIGGLRM